MAVLIKQLGIDTVTSASPTTATSAKEDPTGFRDLQPLIEDALVAACEFGNGCPGRLGDAMRYAVLAPGKRLRPALVLMAAEACGGNLHEALPGAVAVEMIHAYSLIHDDLPAMDDDDLRRGRPTCHIKYDEATAILAGDALIAQAFTHLSENIKDPIVAATAVKTLAKAAGPCHLVGGQADDLAAEHRFVDSGDAAKADPLPNGESAVAALKHLESIHQRKTGALIAASLSLGATLGGGTERHRSALACFAENVGLAFQVIDDLLDLTADSTAMGKRTGKDAIKGKLTYPGLLGIEGAKKRAEDLIREAQEAISVFEERKWRLSSLANYVLERQH